MTPTAAPETGYRPCVGLMMLNRSGQVFVARRIDTPSDAWQMPQGGIDAGESPRDAAMRELAEETGTDEAEIIAESQCWRSYDLPQDLASSLWRGRYRGQSQKWFALRFTGSDGDIDLNTAEPEFSDWRWVEIDALARLVVPFKRPVYQEVVAEFRHLAEPTRDC